MQPREPNLFRPQVFALYPSYKVVMVADFSPALAVVDVGQAPPYRQAFRRYLFIGGRGEGVPKFDTPEQHQSSPISSRLHVL